MTNYRIASQPKTTGRECKLGGCHRKHFGLGFCKPHYHRLKTYGDPYAGRRIHEPGATCEVRGCTEKRRARGYCDRHYRRLCRYGDPLGRPQPKPKPKCKFPGCKAHFYSKGYCKPHYQRWYSTGDPGGKLHQPLKSRFEQTCKVKDCERKHFGHGYCRMHYGRWRKTGDPHKAERDMWHPGMCTMPDCTNDYYAKGYCNKHYIRARKGTLEKPPEPLVLRGYFPAAPLIDYIEQRGAKHLKPRFNNRDGDSLVSFWLIDEVCGDLGVPPHSIYPDFSEAMADV